MSTSDVTALVLTIGEDYTDRAIASVRRQTLPAAETIVVRGVSPFHRAFNSGAGRVRTTFFIQVDADMILDDTCIEDLRDGMADRVALVVGHLRDPLSGRVVGIKLFRTQCFTHVKLRDSVSSETDVTDDLQRQGWTTVYALKYGATSPAEMHTFGEHRPDYSPRYTFCKYLREGMKARYRKAGGGLRAKFQRLHASGHRAAMIAVIAAAQGIFVKEERDIHTPCAPSEEFEFLEQFLNVQRVDESPPASEDDLVRQDLRAGFKRAYALAICLRRRLAASDFTAHVRQLSQADDLASWVALVGLCHGVFVEEYREAEAEEALAALGELLPGKLRADSYAPPKSELSRRQAQL